MPPNCHSSGHWLCCYYHCERLTATLYVACARSDGMHKEHA